MELFHKLYDGVIFEFLFAQSDGRSMGDGLALTFGPPFKRFNNSFRLGGSERRSRKIRPSSMVGKESQGDQNCTPSKDGGKGWASSFEKLLEDPEGLKAFTEFLKKEFSSENINFWIACEKFRKLPLGPEKKTEALRIYQQHLCMKAPEAVNVDFHGRQYAEQALQEAPENMFDLAQKQIFNLMKFDSYPRFLKSDLYKECLLNNSKSNIPTPMKLKKSLSNAEDCRRKSLLPWHRKNRSKSKDGYDADDLNRKNSDDGTLANLELNRNELHSSKSSLTSVDISVHNIQNTNKHLNADKTDQPGARTALCRVCLGNDSTTVVQIKQNEPINEMVQRLLEKRGLNYTSFEVYTDKHSKPVDVNSNSAILAGCEVRIQQRVVFKLDLPNRKMVSVKSKATKLIVEVLKPILHRYDYSLDQVLVINKETGLFVDVQQQITNIDDAKLLVQLKEAECMVESKPSNVTKSNKLEEITNKVFEGILHEKADNAEVMQKSEKGSVKSEDMGSDRSSNYLNKFLRRDSGAPDWKKKSFIPRSKALANIHYKGQGGENNPLNEIKKPLIAKWKTGVDKLQVSPCSESDELVEGLTRAQKSRLEDQRGTEINFELPDFLKDKENERKLRKTLHSSSENGSFYFYPPKIEDLSPMATPVKNIKLDARVNYENKNIMPEHVQKLGNLSAFSPNKFPINYSDQQSLSSDAESKCIKKGKNEPPPLPPKPKIIPLKPPNWGHGNFFHNSRENAIDVQKTQKLFLEHTSSSFV